jgi:hypothetical protein
MLGQLRSFIVIGTSLVAHRCNHDSTFMSVISEASTYVMVDYAEELLIHPTQDALSNRMLRRAQHERTTCSAFTSKRDEEMPRSFLIAQLEQRVNDLCY